jgi:lysophospholipase L1-like esterase
MKTKLINAALFITSIIFSLIAFEICLRAYHGEWGYTNFRLPQIDYVNRDYPVELDSELGWVPRRDIQGIDPHTWLTPATILEDGTRSNDGGEVRDANEPILAVGDSFTFGLAMSDWETWPAQLEKLSGRRVINGGVSGYGIDQAFLRAKSLLNRYRISTVIFSFIPDDIRRCQTSVGWGAAKPYFDLDDGRLTLKNVPVPPSLRSAPKESRLLNVLEHSRLVHSVMDRLFPEWWMAPQRSWEKYVYDEEEGKKVACALVHELEELTKASGSGLIVLVQHRGGETASELASGENVPTCLSNPTTRVLDLKSALSDKRLYLPDGGHMSAEGNQFVALEILKILTQGETRVDRGALSPVRQLVH